MKSLPMPRPGYAHVYVLQCGEFFKVGVTLNVGLRIEQFKLGNPYPIALASLKAFPLRQIRLAERDLHEMLEAWSVGREWFTAPLPTIEKALRLAWAESRRREREFRAAYRPLPGQPSRGIHVGRSLSQQRNHLRELRKANKISLVSRLMEKSK